MTLFTWLISIYADFFDKPKTSWSAMTGASKDDTKTYKYPNFTAQATEGIYTLVLVQSYKGRS